MTLQEQEDKPLIYGKAVLYEWKYQECLIPVKHVQILDVDVLSRTGVQMVQSFHLGSTPPDLVCEELLERRWPKPGLGPFQGSVGWSSSHISPVLLEV